MTGGSAGYHEPIERLTDQVMDRHRAIVSLMEELEAVDWYEQRIAATDDPELAAILRHNSDEEKEHAAMVLEWLRRRDAALDQQLRNLSLHRNADRRRRGRYAGGVADFHRGPRRPRHREGP